MKLHRKLNQDKINVGLIGTGIIAHEHAKALLALGQEFVLATAFDADPQKLQKFIKEYPGIVPVTSLDEMLSDSSVDLVVVVTPPSTHEGLVIAALEANKYVLCEKPLSNSMSGALRVVEASKKFPGRLAVGYQMRYDRVARRLMWICEKNGIGGIRSARIQRHSYIPHVNAGTASWWGSWDVAGGGVLITQLIHELDLLIGLMGRPVAVKGTIDTLYTRIESEDKVDATLFFEEGRTGTISASVNSGNLSGEFRIYGDAGDVSMPWSLNLEEGLSQMDTIKALDRALPDTRLPSSSFFSRGLRFLRRRLSLPEITERTPHVYFYADIAKCIRAGRSLPISASDAMASLEVCMAIYESGLSGAEVRLPLQPDCRVFSGVSKAFYDRRPNAKKVCT